MACNASPLKIMVENNTRALEISASSSVEKLMERRGTSRFNGNKFLMVYALNRTRLDNRNLHMRSVVRDSVDRATDRCKKLERFHMQKRKD